MAQDFSQRYPLIDGQGNFGSRDGDGAGGDALHRGARWRRSRGCCSTRSTRARSTSCPTTTARPQEPRLLPRACLRAAQRRLGHRRGPGDRDPQPQPARGGRRGALLKTTALDDERCSALLPGPDFPGGGQIISSRRPTSATPTPAGRGSLKVRARWKIEDLRARPVAAGRHRAAAGRRRAEGAGRRSRSSPTQR